MSLFRQFQQTFLLLLVLVLVLVVSIQPIQLNRATEQLHIEMNQATTATTATSTQQSSDLEGLRLQLEEDGKVYFRNQISKEAHKQLLHTLQTNDCREILTAVVDRGDFATVFVEAGGRNHVDVLEAFLNHGMNINIKNRDGWTALMYASYYGHEECIRFLLDHNVSVDVQDNYGTTALIIATQRGNIKIVELSLEKNVNPDIQDSSGRTALMYASLKGNSDIAQLLLNHGADINLKNNDGMTAIDAAKNDEIKELLQNHVNSSYVLK